MKSWVVNLLIIVSVLGFLVSRAGAEDTQSSAVPQTENLALLAQESTQQKLPILIMYAAEHCEFCERLEQDLLGPMHKSGQYKDRIIIRKVMIDGYGNIRDFNGNVVEANNFAFRRGVQVTPTLQFVDANGNQLAPELIGYNTPEMYAAYVENAIDNSRRAIQSNP